MGTLSSGFVLFMRHVVHLINGVTELLYGCRVGRVDAGRTLELAGGALKVALFTKFLAFLDVESTSFKADLVKLDAVVGVLRIGSESFLVILKSRVVVLEVLGFARGLVVLFALRAPRDEQADEGAQNQNGLT